LLLSGRFLFANEIFERFSYKLFICVVLVMLEMDERDGKALRVSFWYALSE
jgi:hypothetical protein